jgi:DNA-binding NtrC family response regulator
LIPIATTIFLVVILRMERSHKLTDMRMLIPGSEESKVLGELMAAFSNYSIYGENHKETLNEIERALVIYKHTAMANMKTSEIAKEMGMPRPTLYSIYNRLGLKDSIRDVLKRPDA